ncbi:MAG: c-type cytochrome [bacterium]|nr:c-type cytochrome [bacterium]
MKKMIFAALLATILATPAMAMDGKELYSQKKCGMCHGANGTSASKMFPSLAGKDAKFLADETMKIKTGERESKMTGAMKSNPGVKNLTAEEALAIGEYLSSVK